MADASTMGSDGAAIYAQANKPSVALLTPMEALKQAGQAADVINANRLFNANLARGQALQQSIDQDTGLPDPRKANRLLAMDPTAAPVMADAVNQTQTLQGQQQTQAAQRFAWATNALGSLISDNDGAGPTMDRVQQTLAAGAKTGILTPTDQAAVIAGMPTGDDAKSMATRQHMLQTLNEQLQSAQQRLTNVTGAPDQMNDGQQMQPGVRGGPLGGKFGSFTPTGPATQVYPSRADLLSQQSGVDSSGRPTVTSLATRAGQQGAGSLTGPAGAGLANPPGQLPASLVPAGYTGRYAPATPAAVDGAVPVGLAPGDAEAQSSIKQASAKQGVDLQQASDQSPARLSILNNMATDLAHFTPGPGQTRETFAQSLFQRYAPDVAKAFGADPQRVASAESFGKFASQLSLQQAGALGAGTDAKLLQAMHANPNSDMSKLTLQQMIPVLQGNEDAIQAKNQAWQQWQAKNGPGSYGAFSTQFNQSFDPRAFQLLRMAPEDRATMLASMPDRDAFRQKVNAMNASGLLPTPQPAAPPAGGKRRGY